MGAADFWTNQERAQTLLQQVKSHRSWIDPFDKLRMRLDGAREMHELLEAEPDVEMNAELDRDITSLEEEIRAFELRSLLRGPDDFRDAQVEISAGAGGTEAQDWAAMLERMYTRWAERRGFENELHDRSEGEEAGIKGAVLEIRCMYAYGFLRPES